MRKAYTPDGGTILIPDGMTLEDALLGRARDLYGSGAITLEELEFQVDNILAGHLHPVFRPVADPMDRIKR